MYDPARDIYEEWLVKDYGFEVPDMRFLMQETDDFLIDVGWNKVYDEELVLRAAKFAARVYKLGCDEGFSRGMNFPDSLVRD